MLPEPNFLFDQQVRNHCKWPIHSRTLSSLQYREENEYNITTKNMIEKNYI